MTDQDKNIAAYMKYHEELKSFCINQVIFETKFIVDFYHIDRKANSEQIRANLGKEQLASIILNGSLNYEDSKIKASGRCEIAIEGCFRDFPWLVLPTLTVEIKEQVYIRVVVREGKRGINVIVTAYDLWEQHINQKVNEVEYEIWQ